jgi:signal transduction histidine kinase
LEYLNAAERAVLRELSVRACVPIFSGARLTAILLICLPAGDTRVNDVDLDLLIRLGRQAGLALENAELHQLERERLKTLHQAQQLAVAGQMAATVAHEIRNPLTAIRSTVQYVVQSSAPWEAKCDLLNEILEEVDRIERTVGGILGLSRSVESEFADIELIDTVEQSLLLIGAYAQAHGVTVERQFEADSLPIRGDARELHQLCMNLFLNACQAMTDGGRLVLRCAMWQPSSGTPPVASLQVRDTGCGIPSDQLKRVFDPFFTTKRAGTGLGLPICLDIVARHGGNIRVESAEGIGTTATVLLPIRSI